MKIVWFRHDLRLDDHPALAAAVTSGEPLIPAFIWSPEEEGRWAPGAASRWWLHHSLQSLDADLRRLGSRLILRRGAAAEQLLKLAQETGASAVYWNRRYEPAIIARDSDVKTQLKSAGLDAKSFNGSLIVEPWDAATKQGKPYQVYTAFWSNSFRWREFAKPVAPPESLPTVEHWPASDSLDNWKLLPTIAWDAGLRQTWQPGETTARRLLGEFTSNTVRFYAKRRDLPATSGTSRLSPYLHFGEISARRLWHSILATMLSDAPAPTNGNKTGDGFELALKQIAWREFGHHLLFHFPHTVDAPLRPVFARFPWRDAPKDLRAWQRSETGVPLVDAGMRELWSTGWMHNRVRMVVASFLVKNLLLPWQRGAEWFWDTLVDADLANNTLGWQWTAGCGADAAPYFRVFNPVLQSEKFDARGEYLRRWIPELASLPDRWIHKPWLAPATTFASANLTLGRDYPRPIVDLEESRKRALAAFQTIRSEKE